MQTLTIEKRDTHTNSDAIREGGKVLGVLYGPKEDSTLKSLPMNREIVLAFVGDSTMISVLDFVDMV